AFSLQNWDVDFVSEVCTPDKGIQVDLSQIPDDVRTTLPTLDLTSKRTITTRLDLTAKKRWDGHPGYRVRIVPRDLYDWMKQVGFSALPQACWDSWMFGSQDEVSQYLDAIISSISSRSEIWIPSP